MNKHNKQGKGKLKSMTSVVNFLNKKKKQFYVNQRKENELRRIQDYLIEKERKRIERENDLILTTIFENSIVFRDETKRNRINKGHKSGRKRKRNSKNNAEINNEFHLNLGEKREKSFPIVKKYRKSTVITIKGPLELTISFNINNRI